MNNPHGLQVFSTVFRRCISSLKKIRCLAAITVAFAQLALLARPGAVNAQSNFSSWGYYRQITIGTPTGVTASQTNFPTLVRLNGHIANGGNANDSLVFVTAKSNKGWDIRFSNTGIADSIPFEIERYDSVNMKAEFWVQVPNVTYNSATTFNMYWDGVTSVNPSNPPLVFSPRRRGKRGSMAFRGD